MTVAWYDVLGYWREIKQEKNAQKYKQVSNAFNYITIFTADFFATVGFLFPWGLFLEGAQTLYQKFGRTVTSKHIVKQTAIPIVVQRAQENSIVKEAVNHSRLAEFMAALDVITTAWRHVFTIVGAGVGVMLSFVLVPVLYLYRDKIKKYIDLDKDYVTIDLEPINFWKLVFGRLKRDSEFEFEEHLELVEAKLPFALHYNKNKHLWLAVALVIFAMSYLAFVLCLPYMMIGLMTSVLGFGWLAIAVGVITAALDVLQITDSWIKNYIDSEMNRQNFDNDRQQRKLNNGALVKNELQQKDLKSEVLVENDLQQKGASSNTSAMDSGVLVDSGMFTADDLQQKDLREPDVSASKASPNISAALSQKPINLHYIEPNEADPVRFIRACRHTPAFLGLELKKHFDSYQAKQGRRSPLDTDFTRNVCFHLTCVDLREEKVEQLQQEQNFSAQKLKM